MTETFCGRIELLLTATKKDALIEVEGMLMDLRRVMLEWVEGLNLDD